MFSRCHQVYLPIWGPQTTSEARLVCDWDRTQPFDHTHYESQMFYFNTVTRVKLFPHAVKAEGMDFCYDCRAEIEGLGHAVFRSFVFGEKFRWIER